MSDAAILAHPWGEMTPATPEMIRQRVRDAGVVGAGGAGSPPRVKLQAQVEIFTGQCC